MNAQFLRGTVVEYWFDDGRGGSLLYGEVIAAGPKAARIKWESGLTNRVKQDSHLVKVARDQTEARAAIARASGHFETRASIARTCSTT